MSALSDHFKNENKWLVVLHTFLICIYLCCILLLLLVVPLGMKDRIRIELLPIILPLSMGRTSERPPERTSRQQSRTRPLSATRTSSLALIALTKLSISREFRRFIRTLKSLPQLFVYKDDEMETEEVEMDIGFPTDVKHLTHIGFDGSTSTKKSYMRKSWEDSSTPEIIHFPSVSLRQFELAMASQADSRSQ